MGLSEDLRVPCPICTELLDVRESKKKKPYVVCDACGVQMFVRNAQGISRFEELARKANRGNAFDRLAEMEERYRKTCPKCGRTFWVSPDLIKTSVMNGRFLGYCCPAKGCNGVVEERD